MITESSVEIEAPASVVWDVYADVERWSEWTASINRVTGLDGKQVELGRHFEIDQPRMPTLVWEVTEVAPGASWSWRQKGPGATTVATHEVVPQGPDRTVVRAAVDQRGPLGVLVGVLMRRLTRRYLAMEAAGLKARSEQRHTHGAPSA